MLMQDHFGIWRERDSKHERRGKRASNFSRKDSKIFTSFFFRSLFWHGLSERGMGNGSQECWVKQPLSERLDSPINQNSLWGATSLWQGSLLFWPATGHPRVCHLHNRCMLLAFFGPLSHTTAPSFLPPNSPLAQPQGCPKDYDLWYAEEKYTIQKLWVMPPTVLRSLPMQNTSDRSTFHRKPSYQTSSITSVRTWIKFCWTVHLLHKFIMDFSGWLFIFLNTLPF